MTYHFTWSQDLAVGPPALTPVAANENLKLLWADSDPARALAFAREQLDVMRRENAADGGLLSCPERRRRWEDCRAFARAVQWRYFEWGADSPG